MKSDRHIRHTQFTEPLSREMGQAYRHPGHTWDTHAGQHTAAQAKTLPSDLKAILLENNGKAAFYQEQL